MNPLPKYCVIGFVIFFGSIHSASARPNISNAVGQMMMVGFNGTTINEQSPIVKAIKNYHIGGVILFDHFDKKNERKGMARNISSPAQLKRLTKQLQYYAKKYHDAPLLIALDQEGGMITALKTEKGFKLDDNYSQQKLGESNNQKEIYSQVLYRADLLKRYGINLNLAPVADLNLNPKNPSIGKLERSFGHDPIKVTKDLMASVEAYRKARIFCTLKHFPGLGSSKTNTDVKVSDVTETWKMVELIPYRELINRHQSCHFIMVAHTINRRLDKSGLEASLSHEIVTGLLRHHLHFRGIIMTDDMDAKAIRGHVATAKAIRLAVLAGNNMILYGGTQGYDPKRDATELYNTMMQLAANNQEARRDIFNSYRRILEVKKTLGESQQR